jgi:hypothetical protein
VFSPPARAWWDARARFPNLLRDQWGTWQAPHRQWVLDCLDGTRQLHEVGCGAGANLRLVQHHRPDIALSGTDSAYEYVRWVRSRVGAYVIQESLPDVTDGPWDTVLCSYVLAYLSPDAAHEAVKRLSDNARWLLIAEPIAEDDSIQTEARGVVAGHWYCDQWAHPWPAWLAEQGRILAQRVMLPPIQHLCEARVYA